MQKPFDTMLAGLDSALEGLSPELSPMDRWMQSITLARDKTLEVQAQAKKWITGKETEIAYFRDVWPVFHSRLGLYIKMYQFELWRLTVPEEGWADLIRQEEGKVAAFFQVNAEFWMYYRSQSAILNEQFTRAYSRSLIFDPLSLVFDPEGATVTSHRAGECGAMEGYRLLLLREKKRLLQPSAIEGAEDYTFGGKDVQFVEWLNLQQASGVILYKGRPADMARVEKWASFTLNRRVSNIYDRSNVLRQRKRDRLRFSRWAMEALEKKFDAQDKRVT